MLTKEEAANYCGFKSINGFGSWTPVHPVKIGNKVLYDQKTLDEWLDQLGQSQPTKKRGFAERAGNEGHRTRY
jgi:hypothetical protein